MCVKCDLGHPEACDDREPSMTFDMHPDHTAGAIHENGENFRAECVCGWTSKPVRSVEAAEHEQWQHGVAMKMIGDAVDG